MARASRALALLLVLPLAGCAVPAAWGVTAEDSRTHLVRAVDETQQLVGGSWTLSDDAVPRGCVIPPWTAGSRASVLRIGTAPTDPQQAAESVDAAWESWGYEVTRATIDPVIEVQGRFGGELIVFRVSDHAMSLQGEGECSPTR